MKLLFDLRWSGPEIAGITRYATQIARALARRDDVELTTLVCNQEQADAVPDAPHMWANDPQGPHPFVEALLPRRINRMGFDVVYCPVFFMGAWPHRYRLVLTIHDMIPFDFPKPPPYISRAQALGWRFFYRTKAPMRYCLSTADRVVTVSHTMKAELEARLTSRELDVVPNGTTPMPVDDVERDHAASNDVVYMGVFSQHKNAPLLVEALTLAPEVTLHLLSRMPAAQQAETRKMAERLGVADRLVIHDGVSDEEYVDLLRRARCLVTASKSEGFGLPVVEAQHQGTPVVCSDIAIFHEVSGEAAVFFDPDSVEACADAWAQVRDPVTSRQLAEAGRANAARYTWDASAEALLDVCRRALG